MKQRIISGFVMALIGIPLFLLGGIPFKLGVGALSILAFMEVVNLPKHKKGMDLITLSCMLIGYLLVIFLVNETYSVYLGISYQAVGIFLLTIFIPIVLKKNYETSQALSIGLLLFCLALFFNECILLMDTNKLELLFVLIVTMATDIGAYFIGSLLGKHKLTKISPKKTWEGSIGGVICALACGIPYYLIVIGTSRVVYLVFIVLLLSIISQFGDLFFSKIKRENDIKDYSNLIPGHGGILDRVDSFSFALMAYVILLLFI